MFGWFRKKRLEDVLDKKTRVKIHGIIFTIQKINPLNYFDGSKAMIQVFDTYKRENNEAALIQNMDKVKGHFADVILAGVIEPKIARKPEDEGIHVDKLFTEWSLVQELYEAIMELTYGKKKLKSLISQREGL